MDQDKLKKNASLMVERGKGILAADESTPTCSKRFEALGIESTEKTRNAYRDMLFTTPKMEKSKVCISIPRIEIQFYYIKNQLILIDF